MSPGKNIRDRYNETQNKIVSYLQSGITKGKHYFKSKYIAKDLGLSPKGSGNEYGNPCRYVQRVVHYPVELFEQHDVDGYIPCPVNFLIITTFFYYAKSGI